MLVVDASVALPACASPGGFDLFGAEELVAPPLLWSESRSALHEALFRRDISAVQALRTLDALDHAPIRPRTQRRLSRRAWDLANEMGWAKTYDAEYQRELKTGSRRTPAVMAGNVAVGRLAGPGDLALWRSSALGPLCGEAR